MKEKILSYTVALIQVLESIAGYGGTFVYGADIAGEARIVSCGSNHTAVISVNNELLTWGRNDCGQLGDGTMETSAQPQIVLNNVSSVSCGLLHTAVIMMDGSLWIWGENSEGQLGTNTMESSADPCKLMEDAVAVSCGDYYTAAITSSGRLMMWGDNSYGQLGKEPTDNISYPVDVGLQDVMAVSCGAGQTAAITADGSLWMWGKNDRGQLGTGTLTNSATPQVVLTEVTAVSCGSGFTAAVKDDGSLYVWGDNAYIWGRADTAENETGNAKTDGGEAEDGNQFYEPIEELPDSEETSEAESPEYEVDITCAEPQKVMSSVQSVSCGDNYIAAVKNDGNLYVWGQNELAQLGTGNTENVDKPVKVLGNVIAVSCGVSHTAAVTADGELVTFGYNYFNELGYDGGDETLSFGSPIQTTPRTVANVRANTDSITRANIAYQSTSSVDIDGEKTIEFEMYALIDESGNPTNYIKIRDLAMALDGTDAQFNIAWNGAVSLVSGESYESNGSEMNTPFSGSRVYITTTSATMVNGVEKQLDAFMLVDDNDGGYTYYKLRDIGEVLGFNVSYSSERGIYIETDKPYTAD